MKNSIRNKLWLEQFLFTLILTASVMIGTYTIYFQQTQKAIKTSCQMFIDSASSSLQWSFNSLETYAKMAISDADLQAEMARYSTEEKDAELQKFEDNNTISSILSPMVFPRTPIEGIGIYEARSGKILSTNGESQLADTSKREAIQETVSLRNLVMWDKPRMIDSLSGTEIPMLPFFMKIYYSRSGEQLGLMECQVPLSEFSSVLVSLGLGESASLLILDDKGNLIASNKSAFGDDFSTEDFADLQSENRKGLWKHNGFLVGTKTIPQTGWTIIARLPLEAYTKPIRNFTVWFFLCCVLLMLLLYFLSSILSKRITQPILQMESSLRDSQAGHSKHVPVLTDDEIGKLARSYNEMVDRVDLFVEENKRKQKKLRQYELALLQAQINPHFLNNTLENICGLIELDRKDDSISLIRDTADFYRSVLSGGETVIPLELELKTVELFLKIENVRYSNRIHYTCDVSSSLLKTKIIKLTLQPLIENSIYHGLKPKDDPWEIRLTGREVNGDAVLTLTDNGIGMPEKTVRSITKRDMSSKRRKKVGVYSTSQRLKLSFGSKYGLQYSSAEGIGTSVEIRIPLGALK